MRERELNDKYWKRNLHLRDFVQNVCMERFFVSFFVLLFVLLKCIKKIL